MSVDPDTVWRLEQRVTALEISAERDRASNAEAIRAIKGDTAELLGLFRAGKLGASLFRWFVIVTAAAGTGWTAFHDKLK
jgi:hypothetical protein